MGLTFFLQLIINGLVVGSIYALVATGFVIIYKSTSALNLAQGEFLTVGAYVCMHSMVGFKLPFLAAFGITLLFTALLGTLIERVVLRPLLGSPVISVIMVTLGLSGLLRSSLQLMFGTDTLPFPEILPTEPIHLGPVPITQGYLYAVASAAMLLVLMTIFFHHSRTGLALRATASNQQTALSMGISVKRMFAISWGIAAVVSAIGGILLAAIRGGVDMSLAHMGLKVLPVVILGGLDSIAGAIVGGLVIVILENISGGYLDPLVGGGIKEVVPYIVLVLILMVRPSGLFGSKRVDRV